MSIVMKFGGTSVADTSALSLVLNIVRKQHAATGGMVCVVSATAGTTNYLLDLARQCIVPSASVRTLCTPIRTRHEQIVMELVPPSQQQQALTSVGEIVGELERYCNGMHVLEECTPESLDAVASFGERLSSTIITHALLGYGVHATEVSATTIIRTDSRFTQARVDMDATREDCGRVLGPLLQAGTLIVTQGFAGADEQGRTTTLGRGGSDASAAIIGAAIGAVRIEIWTDVSGVYSADPRLVPTARPIETLSFGEIRELALFGAKVLHPDTIVPAVQSNIPVLIKNTFDEGAKGTVIVGEANQRGLVHATSLMRPCTMVTGSRSVLQNVATMESLRERLLLQGNSCEHGFLVFHTPDDNVKTSIEVVVADTSATTSSCEVVVCTGPLANSGRGVRAITTSVAELAVSAVVAGASPWSVFVVVASTDALPALGQLHALTE